MELMQFFVLSLALASLSVTVCMSKPTAPLRHLAHRTGIKWLYQLVCCPWCLLHWLSLCVLLVGAEPWWLYWFALTASSSILAAPIVWMVRMLDKDSEG